MKRLKPTIDADTKQVHLGVRIPSGLNRMLEAHRKQKSAKLGLRVTKTDVVRGILVAHLTSI